MKRFILITVIGLITALFATQSFAQQGNGGYKDNSVNNMNPNNGNSSCLAGCDTNGSGMMSSGMGGYHNQYKSVVPVKNAGEAKAIVKRYIDENLKGYTIGEITTYAMRRGEMYQVETVDASGNIFYFHISPSGYIRGPMPANILMPQATPVK